MSSPFFRRSHFMYTDYNAIGKGYNQTRYADPYLTGRFLYYLEPQPEGWYLDIGCGTGNYTRAMAQKGYAFTGIDPSSEMLSKARDQYPGMDWRYGRVEELPLENESVDGATAILTTHHWEDPQKGYAELYRVLKPGARLVLFTSSPEQMKSYWLTHYFPEMMDASCQVMHSRLHTENALRNTGFDKVEGEPYFVTPDLQDLFLQSGKQRPELYLQPEVRSGISSFAALSHKDELEHGLHKLAADISSGSIVQVQTRYESELGDYLIICAKKSL